MKIGFCMLLWTTSVNEEHRALLEDIKATGYDGVEVPIFDGTPDDYAAIGKMLDEIGLGRTAISVIGALDANPLSEEAADRQRGVDHLAWPADPVRAKGGGAVDQPRQMIDPALPVGGLL